MTFILMALRIMTLHNDIHHNGTQNNDTQHNDIDPNGTQNNENQHYDTRYRVFFMLSIAYAECCK
jgi:hypothetical protein